MIVDFDDNESNAKNFDDMIFLVDACANDDESIAKNFNVFLIEAAIDANDELIAKDFNVFDLNFFDLNVLSCLVDRSIARMFSENFLI